MTGNNISGVSGASSTGVAKASFRNMSVIEKYMAQTGQDFKKLINQVNSKKNTIEFSSPPKKLDETEVKDTDKSIEDMEESP
jgi:hypothetical protein